MIDGAWFSSRICPGASDRPTKSEIADAVAAGRSISVSYRTVISCSAGRLRRSRAASRTAPRQRIAHLPAGDRPAQMSRSSSVSTPKNGLGNSESMLAKLGLNQDRMAGSRSMHATTSRPSRMNCTIRASGNASVSASAQ